MPLKRKISMTAIDLKAVTEEIKRLIPLQVANIYDYSVSSERGIIIKAKSIARKDRPLIKIVAEPSRRLHITSIEHLKQVVPSSFVMGLRKYLRGGIITSITQHDLDRISLLSFNRGYKLIIELLPRGTIVLTDKDNKIVLSSKSIEMKDRSIRRGLVYQPPPIRTIDISTLDSKILSKALEYSKEIVRGLSRNLGLPGEFLEEALLRVGVEPLSSPNTLRTIDLEEIASSIKTLYGEVLKAKGFIVKDAGTKEALTAVPFEPKALSEKYGYIVTSYESHSAALEEYFSELDRRTIQNREAAVLDEEKRRLLTAIEKTRRSIEEYKKQAMEIEKRLSAIGEKMHVLYEIQDCFSRKGAKLASSELWSEECKTRLSGIVDILAFNREKKLVRLKLDSLEIELPLDKDPSRLLVELSKEAGILRAKAERAEKALKELQEKLKAIEKVKIKTITRARALLRKREWYEAYHWLITSNGLLAIGGRNADQNEAIVRKYLSDNDIFMHADIHGAPVTILLVREGKEVTDKDLKEAAIITAVYSKAWKAGLGAIDVYWVYGNQVSKSPPPGQYLQKGSFMVYGKRNYIKGVKLELAIGVGIEDDSPLILIGPRELVSKRSIIYAILVPGDNDPSLIAKRIKSLFVKRVSEEYVPLIDVVKSEEIRERIPGPSRIIAVERSEPVEPARGPRETV